MHAALDPSKLPALTPSVMRDIGEVLSDSGRSVIYGEGSTIFRAGDTGDCAFLIERGHVEITNHDGTQEAVLAVLEPGDLLGELAAIDDRPRSATARALGEVQLFPLTREQIDEALVGTNPIVALLLRVTIGRLRDVIAQEQNDPSETINVDVMTNVVDKKELELARERTMERLKLESALKDALALREFELHYQPIVSVPEGRLVGFEALLRWFRPGLGYMPPSQFIDAAEHGGLIVPLGLWILEHACRQMSRFQRIYQRHHGNERALFVSVNLSPRQFAQSTRLDSMIAAIERTGIDPAWLKLEMTESLLVENPELAARGLRRLKRLGLTLAIDDFGTGYSSLSYLHRYPLDSLKIDRSFIAALDATRSGRKVVQGIIGLAKALEMDVVAEGVETKEQMELLVEMGCDHVQGYLYAKAMAEDDVLNLLENPVIQPQDGAHLAAVPA